jgi:hypothetical protein
MNTPTFSKLQEILSTKLGSDTLEALSYFMEHKINLEMKNNPRSLATKEDISRVELKIVDAKFDLIRWIFGFGLALCFMAAVLVMFLRI